MQTGLTWRVLLMGKGKKGSRKGVQNSIVGSQGAPGEREREIQREAES